MPTPAASGQIAGENRVDALIRSGAVTEAIRAFDTQIDRGEAIDGSRLKRLALAVLRDVASNQGDPEASVEACLALLAVGPDDCEPLIIGGPVSGVTRLRLIARELPADPQQAQRRLAKFTSGFSPEDWNVIVDTADAFPPAVAVQLLTQALAAGDSGARYGAIDGLASIQHDAALPVLKSWAGRHGAEGRVLALAAVARAGDAAALSSIVAMLPELHGPDLLAAGVALASRRDPRGLEAVRYVLNGPEELLRLEAALALARMGDGSGRDRLEAEAESENAWVRLRAIEKLRKLRLAPTPNVWRQMADSMPWIRVRAAQAVLEASEGAGPGPAPPAPPR